MEVTTELESAELLFGVQAAVFGWHCSATGGKALPSKEEQLHSHAQARPACKRSPAPQLARLAQTVKDMSLLLPSQRLQQTSR